MAYDSASEPEDKGHVLTIRQGGLEVRVRALGDEKFYESQLAKAAILILLGQWTPPGGTPRV
jgi:hypothetical protein